MTLHYIVACAVKSNLKAQAQRAMADMFNFGVLRELRKREGMTIADLSQRTGISAAVISKLERNQTMAEMPTLFRLSRAFGLSAADLLALVESRLAHRQRETEHVTDGFRFREARYANARCLYGTALKGARVSRPEIHQDDFEMCWVLEGVIRLSLPHETQDLRAGDCIQFDALFEHGYEAIEDSRMIILHLRKDKRF